MILALTGGIATGKSTCGRILRILDPSIEIFDCDQSARKFLKSPRVIQKIIQIFGKAIVNAQGQLMRESLRQEVFHHSDKRQALENVIHPLVREECLEKLEISRKKEASSLFIADVPLLFESGFDFGQESHLVIATSEETQRARLKARNHFDDNLITSILNAQWPMMEKVARADVVFWNEGPIVQLEYQLARFLKTIKNL